MGEREGREVAQKELDSLIAAAQSHGEMDGREALELLLKRLMRGKGYYFWTPLGTGSERTWQLRQPRPTLTEAEWLKAEPTDILHICHPSGYLNATVDRDKSDGSKHAGYVRDKEGFRDTVETFYCEKCGRKTPLAVAKKGKMLLAAAILASKMKVS